MNVFSDVPDIPGFPEIPVFSGFSFFQFSGFLIPISLFWPVPLLFALCFRRL